MDYDDAVIEFLSQKDNFRLAVEVSEHLEQAKARIQVGFWTACRKRLEERLKVSKWAKTWQATIDPDEDLGRKDAGVYLIPSDVDEDDDDPSAFTYCLKRWFSNKVILYPGAALGYYGLWQEHRSKEVERFAAALKRHGFNESSKETMGWLKWRTYETVNEFLLAINERAEELAENGVEVLWDTFEKTAALAEKATAALRSGK